MSDVESDTGDAAPESKRMTFKLPFRDIEVGEEGLPYIFMIIASIILLLSCIGEDKNQAYAISVAVITLVLAITAVALMNAMPDTWDKFGTWLSYFMLLWNSIGAIVLTFNGPFLATTNGYFASWALVIFSIMVAGFKEKAGNAAESLKTSGPIMGLLFFSTVLTLAILFVNFYNWRTILALIVSLFTMIMSGFLLFLEYKGSTSVGKLKMPLLAAFATLWTVVVAILTFSRGVFMFTSNGYFGAWGGFVCCIYAASTATVV